VGPGCSKLTIEIYYNFPYNRIVKFTDQPIFGSMSGVIIGPKLKKYFFHRGFTVFFRSSE
jgi:hypothetical protein